MADAKADKAQDPVIVYLFTRVVGLLVVLYGAWAAFDIRTYAIQDYGRIIHEFDPWFNYRATEYLNQHGAAKFFKWFDYMSWYPLGRAVGTTIYPGMQFTAVFLYRLLNAFGVKMSLNDVCVFVPCWFGVVASLLTGLLAAECSGSKSGGAFAVFAMAIMPAHLMRSVGGGYDNESVAVTAMVLTWYVWCRSLRRDASWPLGALAGLCYAYMVAVWGGYVFVLNMIGLHAAVLVLLGRFSDKLHKSYTLFVVIGTLGAIQTPVVGMSPFKSAEQIGPLFVFLGMQAYALCEHLIRKQGLTGRDVWAFRRSFFTAAAGAGALGLALLVPTGYFGPLSLRVRSLFIKHTRTGNPLVDSVAEHQPTSADAYWHHLHYGCYAAPLGFILTVVSGRGEAKVFLVLYAMTAYYFANKMNRLIILMGPVASALTGIAMGMTFDYCVRRVIGLKDAVDDLTRPSADGAKAADGAAAAGEKKEEAAAAGTPGKAGLSKSAPGSGSGSAASLKAAAKKDKEAKRKGGQSGEFSLSHLREVMVEKPVGVAKRVLDRPLARVLQAVFALALVYYTPRRVEEFWNWSHMLAHQMSSPSVVFKAQLHSGEVIIVTDYLDAYHWLRENTPEDARVLSWWDYGYQITGIANRTSLADGNTWNLEHIALLGRCLTSPEQKSHRIVRHLADYVLVWSGGGGDDLAKSPHMARIGTSVFQDICGAKDPMCHGFGFIDQHGTPTRSMAQSTLYRMTMNNLLPGVSVNGTLWEEVYTSKYRKVRIYKVKNVSQKSKEYLADPKNRKCDAPGSWYCPGVYPPAIRPLLPARMLEKH